MSSELRIAFFGGTFDPPHRAHVELLKQVQEYYHFDKIWVVPAKFPPAKTPLAPYEKRLSWSQKVFNFGPCEVSDVESKAVQTMFGKDIFTRLSLQEPTADFFWILGSDQFDRLAYWHEIDDYAPHLTWLVLLREKQKVFSNFKGIGSKRLRRSSCAYQWANVQPMPRVSSSDIREKLTEEESMLKDVPEGIRDEVQHFYKQNTERGKI